MQPLAGRLRQNFAEGTTNMDGSSTPTEPAGEDYLKRAKVHAEKCGIFLVEAAAHLGDSQLVALDEWRASVQSYAAKHKCGLDEARIAVPMTGF